MVDISFFKNLSLKSKLGLWEKTDPRIIGIDIGSSSIKLVQLKKEKERGVLETYGEITTGPYEKKEVGQVAILNEDQSAEAIKDLLKESGVKTSKAIFSIPLKSSFITTMEFPMISEQELKEAVAFEARRYIPLPLSEVDIDWWPLPKALEIKKETEQESIFEKKDKIKVLLVAIHKEIIEKYRNIASKTGLKIKGFEIEVFSLARSAVIQELSPILLIDLGASSTKVAIADYGIIRLTHQFQKGSMNITASLAGSLNIEFSRAEKLKKEIGLSQKPEDQEIVSVIKPLLERIFSEIKRIMINYNSREKRSINHVILSGGGSALKGITDFAINNLGIEVKSVNPFRKVAYPLFLDPVLEKIGPSLAISVGLALRGLKDE